MSTTTPEGSGWFWKIFGGAVISMIAILAITLANVINTGNQQNKNDLLAAISEIRLNIKEITGDLAQQKEKLSKIESTQYDKEISDIRRKIEEIEKTVNSRSEKIAAAESMTAALKEQVNKNENNYTELYKKIVELENEIKLIKAQSQSIKNDVEIQKTKFNN
jgi:predicted nuclease with TOPRIM domain